MALRLRTLCRCLAAFDRLGSHRPLVTPAATRISSARWHPWERPAPLPPLSPPQRVQLRTYEKGSPIFLNRFLFDPCEVDDVALGWGDGGGQPPPTVKLRKEDYRTVHAAKILGLRNGDALRAGVVGGEGQGGPHAGLVTDGATVEWLPEGKIKKAEPTRNGEPPGSLRVTLRSLVPPPDDAASSSALSVSLVLALPRPLQLGRLLPMIAQMGVDRLVLTGAKKVPKDYFGSHLFRKPNELRRCLIEGLCQAGDVRIPRVTIVRSLKRFLEDNADDMFPPSEAVRAFAHPQRAGQLAPPRMRDLDFPPGSDPSRPRVVLAVGPEGGWEEDYEIDLLREHGFQEITLGTRVLRSDVAVVSLLGLAHDLCAAKAAATMAWEGGGDDALPSLGDVGVSAST